MTVTSVDSNTQTATLDTEHTLTTKTDAGIYQFVCDLSNMANGDITVFRIYTKVSSGKTSRVAFLDTKADVQIEKNLYSVPIAIDTEIKVTLEQTDGTGRDYYWNLLKI